MGRALRHQTLRQRLERRRQIDPVTECWLWTGFIQADGHAKLKFRARMIYVHRAAMHVYKNFDLESSKLICHKTRCPNKHCFNPEHLYVGTQSSNMQDSHLVGRRHWGG